MQMLKPIKIGPVEVASPVILAPMTASPICRSGASSSATAPG